MNRPLAPILAGLLALSLPGCATDSRPVARIGSRAITVKDYYAAAAGAFAQYPPQPDEAKAMLVEDLVRRELLLLEAERRGLFRDTLVINYRRLKEEELLIQAVGRSLLPASVAVSDDEVREFHAMRDSTVRVQLIYTFTRRAAEAALHEIRAGVPFEQVANRFNPAGMMPPGGEIGDQVPGNLVPPLDDSLLTARPGVVMGPLESPAQGWFVMRVVSRAHREQPPLESQRAGLAEMLRQRKQRSVAIRQLQKLRRGYALRLVPGAGQAIFEHFNTPPPGGPSSYSAADRARVLARWESSRGPERYTFADALADLDVGGREKPNALVLPAIEQWILVEVTRRIQVAEGRRRGLPQDPAWRRQLDETVNNYVLEAVYTDEVLTKATTGPEEARAAYERSRARFERLEGMSLQVMDFPDSAAANAFIRAAGPAGDLRAAAQRVAGAPEVRDLEVTFPSPDPDWAQVEPSLTTMREGDAIGPFPIVSGWRVVRVSAKRSSVTPFEALDPTTQGALAEEGLELARERRLLALIEQLRRTYPVQIDQPTLKKLPWPVPANTPTGQPM